MPSHPEVERPELPFPVDTEIADLVVALQRRDFATASSCQGDAESPAHLVFKDLIHLERFVFIISRFARQHGDSALAATTNASEIDIRVLLTDLAEELIRNSGILGQPRAHRQAGEWVLEIDPWGVRRANEDLDEAIFWASADLLWRSVRHGDIDSPAARLLALMTPSALRSWIAESIDHSAIK